MLYSNGDRELRGRLYRYSPDGSKFPYIGPREERYCIHPNGGGLVARTAEVAPTVHVGPQCLVFGHARLKENVRLTGRAQVGGFVIADGGVIFSGRTRKMAGEFHGQNRIIHDEVDTY